MKHLIFHLNILVEPISVKAYLRVGTAEFLAERFGDTLAWLSAYEKIQDDWDSYHADLNFSGDEGIADMREARFRIMRALFRITGKPEPSQEEIHALADDALKIQRGSLLFGHYSHPLIRDLAEHYSITLVSYFPQIQLESIVKSAELQDYVSYCIGADTFEHYEMNQHYFEMLLNRLKAKPEDCIYIDKQEQVLEAASKVGIKIFSTVGYKDTSEWYLLFDEFLAKEMPK